MLTSIEARYITRLELRHRFVHIYQVFWQFADGIRFESAESPKLC